MTRPAPSRVKKSLRNGNVSLGTFLLVRGAPRRVGAHMCCWRTCTTHGASEERATTGQLSGRGTLGGLGQPAAAVTSPSVRRGIPAYAVPIAIRAHRQVGALRARLLPRHSKGGSTGR